MQPARILTWLTALLIAGVVARAGRAQLANRKETLQGHRSIFLTVNIPESDEVAQQFGLRKESFERYLLQQLQQTGVPVSNHYTDQTLILEIQVDLLKVIESDEGEVFAFISQFEAIQPARLATNQKAALVTTWRSTKFGAVTLAQKNLLRDSVLQSLEQFLRDFQEVQGIGWRRD